MMLRSDNYMNQYLFYIKQQSWGKLLFDFIKNIWLICASTKTYLKTKVRCRSTNWSFAGDQKEAGEASLMWALELAICFTHKHSTRTKWASFPPSCKSSIWLFYGPILPESFCIWYCPPVIHGRSKQGREQFSHVWIDDDFAFLFSFLFFLNS